MSTPETPEARKARIMDLLSRIERGEKIRVRWLDAVETVGLKPDEVANAASYPHYATLEVIDEGYFVAVTSATTGHDVLLLLQRKKKKLSILAIPVDLICDVIVLKQGKPKRARVTRKARRFRRKHAVKPIIGRRFASWLRREVR